MFLPPKAQRSVEELLINSFLLGNRYINYNNQRTKMEADITFYCVFCIDL